MLESAGASSGGRLSVVLADLDRDTGWREAVRGCDYVLHVASPFPPALPADEDELVRPARDGTLRVLRASRDAGVKRVVLTSSFAAIGYGHPPRRAPFDERDWTDVNGAGVSAYVRSKTVAERAAWDFVEREGGGLELAAINPAGVLGPVLGPDYSTSILLVKRLMDGAVPGLPRFDFGVVDVRDVADLHLRAMTHAAARGERFLAVAGDFVSISDIAWMLKRRLGDAARKVPTRHLPDWAVRLAALFDPAVRQILPELGRTRNATGEKAVRLLGWKPRSAEDAVTATAESLIAIRQASGSEPYVRPGR